MKQKPIHVHVTRVSVTNWLKDRWEFKPVKYKWLATYAFHWLRKIGALKQTVTHDDHYVHKLWVDQPSIERQIEKLLYYRTDIGLKASESVIYIGYDQFAELATSRHLFLQVSSTEYKGIPVVIDPRSREYLVVNAPTRR